MTDLAVHPHPIWVRPVGPGGPRSVEPKRIETGDTATAQVVVTAKRFTVDDAMVTVRDGRRVIGVGRVKDGVASVELDAFEDAGPTRLTASFTGSDFAVSSSTKLSVNVRR